MKRRKFMAVLMAAALSVSTFPAGVQAAGSYQEAEKAALETLLENFTESYAKELETYSETMANGSGADITLELGDAGKSLLGMIAPADISWLNNVQFLGDVSIQDNGIAEMFDVNVNGTKICTMEVFMDTATMDTYVRIPELADGYIKANAADMSSTAATDIESTEDALDLDEDSEILDEAYDIAEDPSQFMTGYMETLTSLETVLPDAETAKTLLDRYAAIFLSHLTEGESGTDTLTVSDVSQECTTFEGTFSQKEAVPAVTELLSTAKEDEELKSVIEAFAKAVPDAEISYDDFQTAIDSALEDVTSDTDASDDSFFTSKIWMDSEDKVVGRELSFTDESGTQPIITWQSPTDGTNCGFFLSCGADDQTIEIAGSGVLDGSLLSGHYELSVDSAAMIGIDVTDYDTEAMTADGILNGNYNFSILPGVGEDSYNMLSSFGITAAVSGGQTDGKVSLALTSASAPMLTMTVEARKANAVEFPDPSTMENIYDTSIEEDGERFTSEMTLDTIMANLTTAGMPEGFIEAFMSAGSEESAAIEEDYATDETAEETTGTSEGNDISAGTGTLAVQ